MDMRQIKAIELANKARILKICPQADDGSGVYLMTREEDGFKYAYIGQAKHLLTRLAQHLSGYQHIDLSIKKHGLYSTDNPYGWEIGVLHFPIEKLDEEEKKYIKIYANNGYQLRNVTAGGQGKGKTNINSARPARGYYDGLEQGKRNSAKFIANLFDKHLYYAPKKDPPTKNQVKAMQKLENFLENYSK